MRHFAVHIVLLVITLVATGPVGARQSREWWPGVTYDPAVPSPASVLGYDIGDYWTEHVQLLDLYNFRASTMADVAKER